MLLVLTFLFLSLSSISCCDIPLITINQLVPPTSTSLHKSPSLFNMTLPTDSLTLTGLSLSCERRAGCGSLASITLSYPDNRVTIDYTLLRHYISSNWSYDTSFKLYLGPVSPHYLTLSLEFESIPSPVAVSSILYGCDAELEEVPTRQIQQYDLIPAPSTPDSEYTGITHNDVTSGGVGILTDQLTRDALTWDSLQDKNISILFRFDAMYDLTQLIVSSSDPPAYSLVEISTDLRKCEFTQATTGSVRFSNCSGSYLFVVVKCVSDSVSISEVQLLTKEGQLSGKSYPLNVTSKPTNTNTSLIILVTTILTFLLTSFLFIVIAVAIFLVLNRRKGYDRWIFRSKRCHKRKGDYVTMKGSGKLSGCADPPSQTPDKIDHVYCTLKIKDDLETSSVYVDMSGKDIVNPNEDLPPVPTSPSKENNYMSMKIRSKSEAASTSGGLFSRFRNWHTQWKQIPPTAEEGATDNSTSGKKAVTLNRRGGIRIKSLSQPSTPPPRLSRSTSTHEDTATAI